MFYHVFKLDATLTWRKEVSTFRCNNKNKLGELSNTKKEGILGYVLQIQFELEIWPNPHIAINSRRA